MTERIALYGEQAEASAQLARVFQTAGCQPEPAYVPEAGQSSISDTTRQDAPPSDRLIKPPCLRGVGPAWIMDGTGPGFLAPGDAPADANDPYEISRLCGPVTRPDPRRIPRCFPPSGLTDKYITNQGNLVVQQSFVFGSGGFNRLREESLAPLMYSVFFAYVLYV